MSRIIEKCFPKATQTIVTCACTHPFTFTQILAGVFSWRQQRASHHDSVADLGCICQVSPKIPKQAYTEQNSLLICWRNHLERRSDFPDHILVLGLDANTFSSSSPLSCPVDPGPPPFSESVLLGERGLPGMSVSMVNVTVGSRRDEEAPALLVPTRAGTDFSDFRCRLEDTTCSHDNGRRCCANLRIRTLNFFFQCFFFVPL